MLKCITFYIHFFQRFFCIYIQFCNCNYTCLVLIKIMNIFIQYISDPFIMNIKPSFVGLQIYFSCFLSEYILIIFFIWENVCILRISLYPAYISNRSLSIKRILHSKLCLSKKKQTQKQNTLYTMFHPIRVHDGLVKSFKASLSFPSFIVLYL